MGEAAEGECPVDGHPVERARHGRCAPVFRATQGQRARRKALARTVSATSAAREGTCGVCGRIPLLCVPRQLGNCSRRYPNSYFPVVVLPALPYLGNRSCVALPRQPLLRCSSSCIPAVVLHPCSRPASMPSCTRGIGASLHGSPGGPCLRFLIFEGTPRKVPVVRGWVRREQASVQ